MLKSIGAFTFLYFLFSYANAHAETNSLDQYDKRSAVIFVYHRIGEDQFPETNIRQEQFAAHINEIIDGQYNVLPLHKIIDLVKNNKETPERSVVITFDGGHKSIIENAAPLLLKHELPFTVFLPTDHIDRETPNYMNWDDIKKLAKNKHVNFGIHTASYSRVYQKPKEEIVRQINKARARFREKLGKTADLFSYPFGEYNLQYKEIIEQQDFKAAVSSNSAVLYPGSDIYALPRFSMTEDYGDLDRFQLTANALPLPIENFSPEDIALSSTKPDIGMNILRSEKDKIDQLSCFISGQERPHIEHVGKSRIELRLKRDFEDPRVRVNCTLPAPSPQTNEEQRWRWFGMLLIPPLQHSQLQGYNALKDFRSHP